MVATITVIVACIFGIQAWRKNIAEQNAKIALEKINKYATSNANIDTDGDGLLDWEEAMWGTDFKNPDTDGDGTSDGAEVALGRDPLTKGPNDYINYLSVKSTTTPPTLTSMSNLTETEKMMRSILALAVKDNGSNQDLPATVAKSIVSSINEKSTAIPATFSSNNIKIVTETEASLREYGNALGSIFKKYDSQELEQNKLSIALVNSLKTRDNAVFDVITTLVKQRESQIASILKLKTPSEVVILQINLLNSLSGIIISMQNCGYMITDPARGLIGMKQYQSEATILGTQINAITNHFDNSGITFTASEGGSFFRETATSTTI